MKLKFLEVLSNMRPKPFKWLQKQLDVEVEWAQFKVNMRPHKGKFYLLGIAVFYPIYKPVLSSIHSFALKQLSRNLDKNEPLPKIAESCGKQLITGVFQDTDVQRESAIFVQDLVKRQLVLDSLLQLLLQSIKNPVFLDESKVFGKQLVLDVIKDEEIIKHTLNLLLRVVKDPEFKQEGIELVKYVFYQPEVSEQIVDLLRNSMADQRCRSSLAAAMAASTSEMLMDKETLEKLKLFTYFLLESETSSQNGSIKQMIDMVVDNVIKKRTENSKENEFQRIFAESTKDTDLKLSYEDRMKDLKNSQQIQFQDQNDKSKKRFFIL